MKMIWIAWLTIICSCGPYDEMPIGLVSKSSEQSTATIVLQAADYLATKLSIDRNGLIGKTIVYFGSTEGLSEICRQQEVCGCNYSGAIFVAWECNECQTITHEMGHTAAKMKFDDYDLLHERLGVKGEDGTYIYQFPFEVCP